MFDWFWSFLYGISKWLFFVCDLLMDIAEVLLGINPMTVDGEETDLLTYLINNEQMDWAFAAVCLLAFILLIVLTIFAIIKNTMKEEPGITPQNIMVKSMKAFMMFSLVPILMFAMILFSTEFMKALFTATKGGTNATVGSFMFVTFAEDTGITTAAKEDFLLGNPVDFMTGNGQGLNYFNTNDVWGACELSDFNFIFSWIVGFVVMYNIAGSLVMFVDRAISLVILYLAAPFEIASSVIDDGAHFKTWREQVLSKFLSAYGTIIAVNIYILIIGLVTRDDVKFFDLGIANYCTKIIFILGGALTMRKAMTLVSTLMSSGGAQEMNDPSVTAARGFAGRAIKGALKYNPLGIAARAQGRAIKRNIDNRLDAWANSNLNKHGINTDYDSYRLTGKGANTNGDKNGDNGNGNQNGESPNQNKDQNELLKNALEGGERGSNNNTVNNNNSGNYNSGSTNQNSQQPQGSKGSSMMNNALQNSGNKKKEQ